MAAVQILQRVTEGRVVIVAIESPIVSVLEVVDTRLTRLPSRGRAEDEGGPRHSVDRFAVVIPSGIDHAYGAKTLTVAHKIADIHEAHVEVWPKLIPIVRPRCHDHPPSRVAIRLDDADEARLRVVIPGNSDHVFGKDAKQLRILHGDVAPEHELLVVGLKNRADLLHVLEIDAAQTNVRGARSSLPVAEFESFIATDM